MLHVIALSGGKDSTAMALRLREVEPREYVYLCTPTNDELPEMVFHWKNLERRLGQPILRVTNHTLDFWIDEFRALPSWRMRWCTRLLKIEPTIAWLKAHAPVTHYVGLRADEESREGIYGDIAAMTRFPLREWGWTIRDVRQYLHEQHVTIPRRTDCARCYGQRLSEWKRLWQQYPEIYEEATQQEERIGATFRSPGRDTWPAGLRELAAAFASGRKVRGERPDADEEACRVCRL